MNAELSNWKKLVRHDSPAALIKAHELVDRLTAEMSSENTTGVVELRNKSDELKWAIKALLVVRHSPFLFIQTRKVTEALL